ncbi:hypothetical protein CXG81DRAFT_24523 [Caulochytrium protostelioides]|uniref:DnaJ-domain-containing protein n=1 Tax=Caulochytrium protostelioides TaxID=1555241 RepID=A0A4P9WZI3_9FUNG|nr:DnaJ-domain-containing protein [Caulochytrium protostelioides]RKP02824.1 hypothetical protein CXG81DRAFT_24523 [Caulochytrium protostelioides]|eukprot:RKP02824.1 hypothetical protein CXG81DRAFT_24523 [Caulochytrium protostelioides]
MATRPIPDESFSDESLYNILKIDPTANDEEIYQAYSKEALHWLPDSNPAPEAAERFKQLGDTFQILSDPAKRKQYDERLRDHDLCPTAGLPRDANDGWASFAFVFGPMLEQEFEDPSWFWQPIGGVAGFALGFIAGNILGAAAGAYMGNRLGKVRDVKGQSVLDAFRSLPVAKRQIMLRRIEQAVGIDYVRWLLSSGRQRRD